MAKPPKSSTWDLVAAPSVDMVLYTLQSHHAPGLRLHGHRARVVVHSGRLWWLRIPFIPGQRLPRLQRADAGALDPVRLPPVPAPHRDQRRPPRVRQLLPRLLSPGADTELAPAQRDTGSHHNVLDHRAHLPRDRLGRQYVLHCHSARTQRCIPKLPGSGYPERPLVGPRQRHAVLLPRPLCEFICRPVQRGSGSGATPSDC